MALPTTQEDPNDLEVDLEYDGFGRLTRRINPDGTATRCVFAGRAMRCALVVVLGLALVGCGGGDDRGDAGPRAAIEQFDTSPQAGFGARARLNLALVSDPEATRDAALDLVESEDPDVRIAAAYALSITMKPEDVDALATLLESAISGERVLTRSVGLPIECCRLLPKGNSLQAN